MTDGRVMKVDGALILPIIMAVMIPLEHEQGALA